MEKYDVVIIGAGPTGLSFAASLSKLGLNIAVVEKQSRHTIENPDIDGRDIAITHSSRELLSNLGIWKHIPHESISAIKKANVLNGTSSYALEFDSSDGHRDELGFLVANHLIRKAAFETIKNLPNIHLITETTSVDAQSNDVTASIELSTGQKLTCELLIAADSRFSQVRQKMGLAAQIQDFGRVIIVCQMEHEKPHDNIAYECFLFERTLAVLPLCGNRSSIVMTVSPKEANHLMNMPSSQFNSFIEECFFSRLGKMQVTGDLYSYPLISVYAEQFIAERFALIGDAAVGMHPVTAHGFNFGLMGQHTLFCEIENAVKKSESIASASLLERYQRIHRRATKPLYVATNAIAKLYSSNSVPAKITRKVLLQVANRLSPVKKAAILKLTDMPLIRKRSRN